MTTVSNSNRDAVLGKIKATVGTASTASDADRRRSVELRLAGIPPHLIPERVRQGHGQLVRLFRGFLEGQSATVIEVETAAEIPAAVAGYLRANNLPSRLRQGGDAYLAALPWSGEPQLQRLTGPAEAADEVGLTHATAGVAETGTLVFASGADNPVTLNFMPESNIAVVRGADIVDAYETAWERVRARFGRTVMPRTVNFISGPSRSADIGGKLTIGAHGPRRLCVIIVKS